MEKKNKKILLLNILTAIGLLGSVSSFQPEKRCQRGEKKSVHVLFVRGNNWEDHRELVYEAILRGIGEKMDAFSYTWNLEVGDTVSTRKFTDWEGNKVETVSRRKRRDRRGKRELRGTSGSIFDRGKRASRDTVCDQLNRVLSKAKTLRSEDVSPVLIFFMGTLPYDAQRHYKCIKGIGFDKLDPTVDEIHLHGITGDRNRMLDFLGKTFRDWSLELERMEKREKKGGLEIAVNRHLFPHPECISGLLYMVYKCRKIKDWDCIGSYRKRIAEKLGEPIFKKGKQEHDDTIILPTTEGQIVALRTIATPGGTGEGLAGLKTNDEDTSDDMDDGLPVWAIITISVIFGILVVAGVILIIYCLRRRHHLKTDKSSLNSLTSLGGMRRQREGFWDRVQRRWRKGSDKTQSTTISLTRESRHSADTQEESQSLKTPEAQAPPNDLKKPYVNLKSIDGNNLAAPQVLEARKVETPNPALEKQQPTVGTKATAMGQGPPMKTPMAFGKTKNGELGVTRENETAPGVNTEAANKDLVPPVPKSAQTQKSSLQVGEAQGTKLDAAKEDALDDAGTAKTQRSAPRNEPTLSDGSFRDVSMDPINKFRTISSTSG